VIKEENESSNDSLEDELGSEFDESESKQSESEEEKGVVKESSIN